MPPMVTVEKVSPKESAPSNRPPIMNLARNDTPLAAQMDDMKAMWLLDHVSNRWQDLHSNLSPWRSKMEKWERMAEGNYSDRKISIDPDGEGKALDVFAYRNESLGTSEGFVDFFTAQARDDIFGTRPWLSATPEGKADTDLAQSITRHSSWKLGLSDIEEVIKDGIRIAAWGGTNFVKPRWLRREEETQKFIDAAYSKSTGEPFRDKGGAYIQRVEDLPEDTDGDDLEWRQEIISETETVFDNVCNSNLDYKDIAFKSTAQKLELDHTDFYVRFRMGLLDVVNEYDIPLEKAEQLKSYLSGNWDHARSHRDESNDQDPNSQDNNANPTVELVEGYLRVDVLGNGKPIAIHVIFSPNLNTLFSIDYLRNVSPGGILPVFPLRVHKIPGRIFGIGYLEKYEAKNNSVDRKHNIISLRAVESAHVWKFLNRDALKDPETNFLVADPDTPIELADGKEPSDALKFASAPDMTDGLTNQRDAEMQMMQMQSGITSAAQGELKGVPSANTARGTSQIMSRGATLLKDNIDPLTRDAEKIVEYNVQLLYANQDRDETFIWGEGREAELVEIAAGDVKGLRANVTLTLVTSQNQQKLESANMAIGICNQYLKVPEPEKPAQRKLYIQAMQSIGFRDAEDIIREGAVDPEGILAIVPQEFHEQMKAAMVQSGMIQPEPTAEAPTEEQPSAPVTQSEEP